MIKYELIDEKLAKENASQIKNYLKEVLELNCINKSNEEIENLYNDMLKYIEDGTAHIIGAFEEELLGIIWAYERAVNGEKRYHINYFIVNSKRRHQGIGKNLIEKVYEIAKENQIKKIELMATYENKSAIQFYENEKFQLERVILCKTI